MFSENIRQIFDREFIGRNMDVAKKKTEIFAKKNMIFFSCLQAKLRMVSFESIIEIVNIVYFVCLFVKIF